MARPKNLRLRAALRERAIDYVLAHGLASSSLRPLAKALHTSARMLIHHFGSREGLLQEMLQGMREREDRRIQGWFRGRVPRAMPEFLRWYWKRMSTRKVRTAGPLMFELYALALRDPRGYPGVLEDPLKYWQGLESRAGISEPSRTAEATLLLACTRGLFLDLCATGDLARTSLALGLLAGWMEQAGESAIRGTTARRRSRF
jgi:AcrR family transcriptional regulator